MKQLNASDFFVFGYFGLVTNQLDGQTVKTRSVHRLFEENLGEKVPYYDTEELKKNKLSLITALFQIATAKHIIYLPAQRNLKRFFPVLFFLSRVFRLRIHYFVVGGWLPDFVRSKPVFRQKLKKIDSILVETHKMSNDLKSLGFLNVVWFPNFREPISEAKKMPRKREDALNVVFMSRITKLKGIDTVFEFLDWFRNKSCYQTLSIDFFGPVDPQDKRFFFESLDKHGNANYHGKLEPKEVQKTLSQYDVLLFPTRYPGEGCPGAIIDSYMAGLTVLASNWKYNHEFVLDGKTGYIVSFENGFDALADKLNKLKNDPALLQNLKKNALKFSKKFESDFAWELLKKRLQEQTTS